MHFANPGSVDAQRKNANRHAEYAIFDSDEWSLEFLQARYDAAATEAKAAAFGYRIPPWTERLYSLRRRVSGLLGRVAAR